MALTRAQAEIALQNPNVIRFLNMIAAAEGTDKYGYSTAFGGGRLASLEDHPRYLKSFGKGQKTSAAGRYQFLQGTWDEKRKQFGLQDFGAHSQNIAAVGLLADNGSLSALMKGDFATALQRSGRTWASLPTSPYAQSKRSMSFINSKLGTSLAELPQQGQQGQDIQLPETPKPKYLTLASEAAKDPTAALQKIFSANAKAIDAEALAHDDTLTQQPEWATQLTKRAINDDANRIRRNAVASFFGEPETPNIEIPEALDAAISRYLAAG